MQIFIRNWILMPIMALILVTSLVGCKDEVKPEPEPNPDPAEFAVVEEEVAVPFEGGAAQVTYTLENPVEGLTLAFQPEADWVNTEDLSADGVIKFNVDPNEEEAERTAKVTVTYGEISDSFVVKQAPYVEPAAFEIIVPEDKVTTSTISFQVIPFDKEMTYMAAIIEKATFDQSATPEDYIQGEIEYYMWYAGQYGYTLEEYLSEALYTGDTELLEVSKLSPQTEYIVYAYGLTPQADVLTDLYYEFVTSKAPEHIDMSFDINYDINGPMVDAEVIPSIGNQKYVFNTIKKSDYTNDNELKDYYQQLLLEQAETYELFGLSVEEFVSQISKTGNETISLELLSEIEYVGFAVAIDNSAFLVSDLTSKEFKTGELAMSDNQITVEITNVGSRAADLKITTTNNDPYVFYTEPSANWEGKTNEEILEELINTYSFGHKVRNGDYEAKITGFQPNTEYASFTFGYQAQTATTELVRVDFTTKEAQLADVTFKVIHDKYFDGDEVKAKYPDIFKDAGGCGVLPVTAEALPEDKVMEFKYHVYKGDMTDVSKKPDDKIIGDLIFIGIEEPSSYCIMTYGEVYTIVGFATDYEGNYGPVYRELITLTKDGVSPIDEFPSPSSSTLSALYATEFVPKTLPEISIEDLKPIVKEKENGIRFYVGFEVQPGKVTEKKINNRRYLPVR